MGAVAGQGSVEAWSKVGERIYANASHAWGLQRSFSESVDSFELAFCLMRIPRKVVTIWGIVSNTAFGSKKCRQRRVLVLLLLLLLVLPCGGTRGTAAATRGPLIWGGAPRSSLHPQTKLWREFHHHKGIERLWHN